jgi:hypothetical protein
MIRSDVSHELAAPTSACREEEACKKARAAALSYRPSRASHGNSYKSLKRLDFWYISLVDARVSIPAIPLCAKASEVHPAGRKCHRAQARATDRDRPTPIEACTDRTTIKRWKGGGNARLGQRVWLLPKPDGYRDRIGTETP